MARMPASLFSAVPHGQRMRGAWWALVLLLPLGLSVPSAQAQIPPPTFAIDSVEDPEPILPDIGQARVVVHWTYAFSNAGQAAVALLSPQTTLQWEEPECEGDNGGARVLGPLNQVITLVDGNGVPRQTISGQSNFTVSATLRAPGEVPIKCTLAGKVLAPGGTTVAPDSNAARAVFILAVRFVGLLSVEVPQKVAEARPQEEIDYAIELANFGNSQAVATFEVVHPVEEGWQVQPPAATLLGAPGTGQETGTVHLKVRPPYHEGWNNDETTLQIRISIASTKDGSAKGNDVFVAVLARVRGSYCADVESCEASIAKAKGPECKLERDECDRIAAEGEKVLARLRGGEEAKASPAAWLAGLGGLAMAVALRRRRA